MRSLFVYPNHYKKNITFSRHIYKKKKSSQSAKERKAKYNELSKKKPADLSIKNKQIAFCYNSPFGTLLFP